MHDEIRASSDEIFGVPPQMKLNPPPLTLRSKISSRSDFIHDSGFIPTKADLVEKSTCLRKCFFLVGDGGFVTTTSRSALVRSNCKGTCFTSFSNAYRLQFSWRSLRHHLPPTQKACHSACLLCWWEMVDSDHRSETQQIYSLPPLATRELFHI